MSSRDFNGPEGGSQRSATGGGRQEHSAGWGEDGFWNEPPKDDHVIESGPRIGGAMRFRDAMRTGGNAMRNSGAMRALGNNGAVRSLRNSGAFRAVAGRRGAQAPPNANGGYPPRGGNGYVPTANAAGPYGPNATAGYAPGGYRPDGVRPDGARFDGARPDGARPDGLRPDGNGRTTVLPPPGIGQPGRGTRRAPGRGPWRGSPGGPGRNGVGGPGGPGGRRGPRPKIKGSWWRVWTIRKALGVLGSVIGSLILLLTLFVVYVYSKTPIPTAADAVNLYQNSTVYYADGKTVMGTFGQYDRQVLNYNQIPKVMQDAAVAAEDRSFWTEGGVSPRGILRAAYENIFGNGNSLQGGSTITQQFVRNYYQGIGTSQTMSRKIKEIFVAIKIARARNKQWILTNYLNTIYLGDGTYGVGAAAQLYFGQPVWKLDAAQAAVIAAIIQQPSTFPLPQYHNDLLARWHYVLNGMVPMGDLTAQQAAAMKFPDMNTSGQQLTGTDAWDPYILEQVKNELLAYFGFTENQINTQGLKIVTTINYGYMKQLYAAVQQNETAMKQQGGALPAYAMVGAELQDPTTGAILAEYPGPGQNMSSKACAAVACDLNTAAYTREQVGSSFKPYVLSEAIKEGMDAQTSTLNGHGPLYVPPETEPTTLSSTRQGTAQYNWFKVNNDCMCDMGAMDVRNAFAQSSNTAFTDLIHRVGTKNVINFAQLVGVDTAASNLNNTVGQVGMALGIDSLTVNEQDTMLSTLADNGVYHEPHLIQSVAYGGSVSPIKVTTRQALTPEMASQVQYVMQGVTVNGTGTAAAMSDGRPIIGKTGTTSSFHSAFFLGSIPQAALTIGIFTRDQGDQICDSHGKNCHPNTETLANLGGNTGQMGFGGHWPAMIWHTFMESAFASSPIQQFQTPLFSGQTWNQVPKGTGSHKHRTSGGGTGTGGHHRHHGTPTGSPINTASATATSGATAGTATSATSSPAAAVATATSSGLLIALPGPLLRRGFARRRRRRR